MPRPFVESDVKRWLKKWRNPHNLTRIHLAKQSARYGYKIGDHSYGAPRVKRWGRGDHLEIGPYCSIADDVTILLGGNHRTDWISTYPFSDFSDLFPNASEHPSTLTSPGGITIGADVWIGTGATVLPGIEIGVGAVIAARTVVRASVPPYAIVAGNPSELRRYRFDQVTIERLLSSRWWELPHAQVDQLSKLLLSDDVEGFLDAVRLLRDKSDNPA